MPYDWETEEDLEDNVGDDAWPLFWPLVIAVSLLIAVAVFTL